MTEPEPPKRRDWTGMLLAPICACGLVCWALGSLSWRLDLGNHMPHLWMLIALAGAAVTWRFRWRRLAFAGVALLFAGRWVAPAVGGGGGTGDRPLRVLLANVYTGNPNHQALLDLIAAEQPDVIGLLEVDAAWLADLEPLRTGWPQHREVARADNFGIALYSRVPDVEVAPVTLGVVPSLELPLPDLPMLLTHPLPAVNPEYAQGRDEQLANVAGWIDDHGDRWAVVGDLNATPWSAHFPARYRGGLPVGTWPMGFPTPLRIPIDHVLVGADAVVVDRRLGPDIGSDHRPVLLDLRY